MRRYVPLTRRPPYPFDADLTQNEWVVGNVDYTYEWHYDGTGPAAHQENGSQTTVTYQRVSQALDDRGIAVHVIANATVAGPGPDGIPNTVDDEQWDVTKDAWLPERDDQGSYELNVTVFDVELDSPEPSPIYVGLEGSRAVSCSVLPQGVDGGFYEWQGDGVTFDPDSGAEANTTVSVSGTGQREISVEYSKGTSTAVSESRDLYGVELSVTVDGLDPESYSAPDMIEFMEGRRITYRAEAEGMPADAGQTMTFVFHFRSADADPPDWHATNSQSTTNNWEDLESEVDTIERASQTVDPNAGNVHHTEPWFFVELKDSSSELITTSPTYNFQYWELWIDTFDGGKPWQVVVDSNITYAAKASENCTSWRWDLPDKRGIWPFRVKQWHPSGGNAQNGSDMEIPASDLPDAEHWARFGDKYGTVEVSCEDGEANSHSINSTELHDSDFPRDWTVKKAKVYFPPNVNPDGNASPIDANNPPLWFYYWNETDAGNPDVTFDQNVSLGATTAHRNGPQITGVDNPRIGVDANSSDILGGNSTSNCGTFSGGTISGIDLFHITVRHEILHYSDVSAGVGNADNDYDWLHDGMEVDSDGDGTWDCDETDPNDSNTHNMSCPSSDIDAEFRSYCAEVNSWNTEVGDYEELDWSWDGKQW